MAGPESGIWTSRTQVAVAVEVYLSLHVVVCREGALGGSRGSHEVLPQDVPSSLGGVVRSDFREEVLRLDVLERGRMAVGVLLRHGRTQRGEASFARGVVDPAVLAVPVAVSINSGFVVGVEVAIVATLLS